MSQAVWKTWVVGAVIALSGPLASGCGGDDDGGDAGAAERCPQAGGLDNGCMCASNRPPGIRRCLNSMVWSACECGPPFDEGCQEGDPVECTCPGESEPRTTVCLAEGTYDCDCD